MVQYSHAHYETWETRALTLSESTNTAQSDYICLAQSYKQKNSTKSMQLEKLRFCSQSFKSGTVRVKL